MAKIEAPKGWSGRLAAERARIEQGKARPAPQAGAPPQGAGNLPPKDLLGIGNDALGTELLNAARVPPKVAAEHAGSLRSAIAELGALGEQTRSMSAWRERQFSRVLEQFYKVLGFQLNLMPEAARPEIARRSLVALLNLVRSAGTGELIVPVTSAAIGLFDSGLRLQSRKKLKLEPAEAMAAFEEASKAVLRLRSAIDGRAGAGSAINTFAPLVEQVELGFPRLSQQDRLQLYACTADFIAQVGPKRGFDLGMMAHLSELVAGAAAKAPGAPDRIFALAQDELRTATQGALAEARGGLLDPPANVAPGGAADAQAALQRALSSILDASPVGPVSLFQQVDRLRAASNQTLQAGGGADPVANNAPLQLATILARHASAPAATELLAFFADQLGVFAASAPAVESLARAAAAPDVAAMTRALAQAVFESRGQPPEQEAEVLNALAGLRALPEAAALEASLVLLSTLARGQGDAGLAGALTAYAGTSAPDDPSAAFAAFANRYVAASQLLPQFPSLLGESSSILGEIARLTDGPNLDLQSAQALMTALQATKLYFPLAAVPDLIDSDRAGATGMIGLVDTRAKFVNPPADFMTSLLGAASGPANGRKDLQEELARVAMQIAVEAGHIHGGQALHLPRILADWAASVANPSALHTSARPRSGIALRAEQQMSVGAFLRAHGELSLDFALTAGLHLSPDQITWAIDRVSKSRGRQTARALRDCVFGCVAMNRLDLIEALRTTKSSSKAVSAVIQEVAQYARNNRQAEVPFDALIRGLAAGGDPIADLVKEKAAQAFAGLDLNQLAEGRVDPKGLEEILAISGNVADLLAQYRPEFRSSLDGEIDMGALRPVLLESLKSVLQGTWPKPKYENEVGRRIMAGLTPEQQRIWRETLVASADVAPPDAANDAYRSAVQLLKGLAIGLTKEIRLGGPGMPPLEWSAKSATELRKTQLELLDQLHEAQKGSEPHRALSKKLGVVNANLSVIDLQLALKRIAGDPGLDPKSALLEVRPFLVTAQPSLRRMGGRGSLEAVSEALDVARDIKSSPRQGRYTADEDGLTQMIDSHKSGCLSFGDQRRRWGMAGALADPNIRMLRAYNDDKQTCRAFLKFFIIETEGYKGPALFMDTPVADGGGYNDTDLMYRHMAAKGLAMGVPVIGLSQNYVAGWRVENRNLKFHIDDGNTGVMHSDNLFGGKGSIRNSRGANPTWDFDSNQTIAFPPTLKQED